MSIDPTLYVADILVCDMTNACRKLCLVRLIELALRTSAPRPVGQRMHADWLAGCMQTMMLGVRIAGLLLVETGRPGS